MLKTGIFFDGCHALIGFEHLLRNRLPYLNFKVAETKLHAYLQNKLKMNCKFVFQGWFEGIEKRYLPTAEFMTSMDIEIIRKAGLQYHKDRQLHWSLIEAGIEPIWLQKTEVTDKKTGEAKIKEKGIDTALTISVLRRVELYDLDATIVFTNDKDYEPLFHNIRKNGLTVVTIDCTPIRDDYHSTPRYVDHSLYYKDIFPSAHNVL